MLIVSLIQGDASALLPKRRARVSRKGSTDAPTANQEEDATYSERSNASDGRNANRQSIHEAILNAQVRTGRYEPTWTISCKAVQLAAACLCRTGGISHLLAFSVSHPEQPACYIGAIGRAEDEEGRLYYGKKKGRK